AGWRWAPPHVGAPRPPPEDGGRCRPTATTSRGGSLSRYPPNRTSVPDVHRRARRPEATAVLLTQPTVAPHPPQAVTLFRVSLLGCTPIPPGLSTLGKAARRPLRARYHSAPHDVGRGTSTLVTCHHAPSHPSRAGTEIVRDQAVA